jgi:hypothetical protein
VNSFESLGSPFLEESGHLRDIITSVIMPDEVVFNVQNTVSIGEGKYMEILRDRIFSQKTAFTAPLKQNKLKLLKDKPTTTKTKNIQSREKLSNSIGSRILLASNSGREILASLFAHEASTFPPSLTKNNQMYHAPKSELVDLLTAGIEGIQRNRPPASCFILDGCFIPEHLSPLENIVLIS